MASSHSWKDGLGNRAIEIDWEDGCEMDKIDAGNLYVVSQSTLPTCFPLRIRMTVGDCFFAYRDCTPPAEILFIGDRGLMIRSICLLSELEGGWLPVYRIHDQTSEGPNPIDLSGSVIESCRVREKCPSLLTRIRMRDRKVNFQPTNHRITP
jgi:hypothetical protein